MQHLDDGTLHGLIDGEIGTPELDPIRAHLDGCAACRARLEEAVRFSAEADELVNVIEVPEPGRASAAPAVPLPVVVQLRPLGLAAALIAAVGLGFAGSRVLDRPTAPGVEVAAPAALAVNEAPEEPRQPSAADAPTGTIRETPVTGGRPAETQAPSRRGSPAEAEAAAPATGAVSQALEARLQPGTPAVPASAGDSLPRREQAEAKALADAIRPDPLSVGRTRQEALRMAAAPAPEPAAGYREVTLREAMERLGGRIRLIEGLIPLRLEAGAGGVRVVYPTARAREILVLLIRPVGDSLETSLGGPPGFPADSLARLAARIR